MEFDQCVAQFNHDALLLAQRAPGAGGQGDWLQDGQRAGKSVHAQNTSAGGDGTINGREERQGAEEIGDVDPHRHFTCGYRTTGATKEPDVAIAVTE